MSKRILLILLAVALCATGCSSGSGSKRTTSSRTGYELPQVCSDAYKVQYETPNPDLDRVIAMHDQCLEANLSPKNRSIVINNRGNAKHSMGNSKGAKEDYNLALAYRPDYDSALYNRGNIKYEEGDYNGAVADYDLALASNPNYAKAYGNRAFAYKKLGKLEEAKADSKKALELDPNVKVPSL